LAVVAPTTTNNVAGYNQVHSAADCCRRNGAKLGASANGEVPALQQCADMCSANAACTYFSHAVHWKVCVLCSACSATSGKTQGARYTSYHRAGYTPPTTEAPPTTAPPPTARSTTTAEAPATTAAPATQEPTAAPAATTPKAAKFRKCRGKVQNLGDFYAAAVGVRMKSAAKDRARIVRGTKKNPATAAKCGQTCADDKECGGTQKPRLCACMCAPQALIVRAG